MVPGGLADQLAAGGRLVLPVGGLQDQKLLLVSKDERGQLSESSLGLVRFVPLIGVEGWSER